MRRKSHVRCGAGGKLENSYWNFKDLPIAIIAAQSYYLAAYTAVH